MWGGQGRVVSPLHARRCCQHLGVGQPRSPPQGRAPLPKSCGQEQPQPQPQPQRQPQHQRRGGLPPPHPRRLEPRSKPRGPPRAPLGAFRPQTPEQYLNNSDPVSSTTRSDVAENGDIESAEVYIVPASGRLLTLPASHTRQRDGTSSQSDLIHRSCRLHSNPHPLPPHPHRCRNAVTLPKGSRPIVEI